MKVVQVITVVKVDRFGMYQQASGLCFEIRLGLHILRAVVYY